MSKIGTVIRKTYRIFKNRGFAGVMQKLDEVSVTKIDVIGFYDYIMDVEEIPFNKQEYEDAKNSSLILNWVIPEMGVGSGGHINIFRFVNLLQQKGIKNRIYIFKGNNLDTNEKLRAFLKEHYDIMNDGIEVYSDVSYMKFAHGTFATSWNTAYFVRKFNNTISKFYFVQDFEPYFFAVGSEYMFAENTYRFGFRGITAGDWLKDKLRDEYGMKTSSFGFSYDRDLYVKKEKRDNVKRLFFYARPVTARRAFELGLLSLNEITKRMPEVEVVFAGWDVSNYEIPFKHLNAGSVKLDELADLYAQCDMCLVLSNTNLSLLPLEVMASNSVAVCTKGANSDWLVNDDNAIMVDFDPITIADKIEYYFKNPEQLTAIREKGIEFALKTSWEQEADKVYQAVVEGIKEDEKENINNRW
ncbi:MAG: glycosyltransferase family 4 protein [Lachnospiraceae bacterium]|jgi:Glycosyl transferases group 1.|nr:glycosyltransferase family 4 protein [Lachnospiraceae bacterium]